MTRQEHLNISGASRCYCKAIARHEELDACNAAPIATAPWFRRQWRWRTIAVSSHTIAGSPLAGHVMARPMAYALPGLLNTPIV